MRSSRPGIQTGQSYDLARRLERTRLALQLGSTQPKRWKVGSYIGAESPCSWADHSSAGRAIPAGLVVIVERMLDRARSLSSSSSGAARQGLLPRITVRMEDFHDRWSRVRHDPDGRGLASGLGYRC